jgi:hypothetical protein
MLVMTVIFGIIVFRIEEDSSNKVFWKLIFTSALSFLLIRIAKVYLLGFIFDVNKDTLQYMNMLYIAPLLLICWSIFRDIRSYDIKITKNQIIQIIIAAVTFIAGTWLLLSPSIMANSSSVVTIVTCAIIALFGVIVIIAGGVLVFKMMGGRLQITILFLITGFFFMVVSQLLYIRDTLSGLGTAVNGPMTLVAYYIFGALCSIGGLTRLDVINQEEDLGKSILN